MNTRSPSSAMTGPIWPIVMAATAMAVADPFTAATTRHRPHMEPGQRAEFEAQQREKKNRRRAQKDARRRQR